MMLFVKTVIVGFVILLLSITAKAQKSSQPPFKDDLLFYASYDNSATADFAAGSPEATVDGQVKTATGKVGGALLFDKEGLRSVSYMAAGNFNPCQGTIAFHFKPEWNGVEIEETRGLFYFSPEAPSGFRINAPDTISLSAYYSKWHKDRILAFWWKDKGEGLLSTSVEKWKKDEWRHVSVTWGEELRLYINGKLVCRNPNPGPPEFSGNNFLIGGGNRCSPAQAWIDDVHIYGRALNAEEIGILSGMPEFLIPGISTFAPLQNLYFIGESRISFRWVLGGLIDKSKYSLKADILQNGNPVFSKIVELSKAQETIDWGASEPGQYILRLRLIDGKGQNLDEKTASLSFIESPSSREK